MPQFFALRKTYNFTSINYGLIMWRRWFFCPTKNQTVISHDVEMSIPYRVHAEISQESDIWGIADRDRKNFARTV